MSFEYHLKTPFLDILLIFSNYVAVLSPKYKLLPNFVYLIINKSMSIHADLNRSSFFMFQIKTNWRFLFEYIVPFTCTKRGVIALKTKIQRKGARKVFLCSDVLKLTQFSFFFRQSFLFVKNRAILSKIVRRSTQNAYLDILFENRYWVFNLQ